MMPTIGYLGHDAIEVGIVHELVVFKRVRSKHAVATTDRTDVVVSANGDVLHDAIMADCGGRRRVWEVGTRVYLMG